MALATGTEIGPYQILALLGAGGMGEVYRARDRRLGRDVALKILPESFARDSDRLHRFEQEARAIAALNHPNIFGIFDTGRHEGSPYLVSELLEGANLGDTLANGALPQRKAIDYAVQIAQGLAAAHEKGIVHRDLKPENVFVTRDGRIKILDFGLAKLAPKASAAAADVHGVTVTSSHTAAGVVMGTASYMAPEQVRGEAADLRTDIFAFGAVLYEMLAGQRAFHRDTPAETMTAVLKEDPPEFSRDGHAAPPALEKIVRRCLEKNPEQRFQSAKDLSFALSALSGTDSAVARAAAVQGPRRGSLATGIGVVAAVMLAAALVWLLARHPAPAARMQFAIPVPGEVSHIAISSNGAMLAFVSPSETSGLPMLYVQRVGWPAATLLPGTEGASYPFLSPDGSYVAFFAGGKLQKMSVSGGPPQTLANVLAARGGSWGSRNVIIYSPDAGTPIWRVNANGSGAAQVTDLVRESLSQDQTQRWPLFLPDGEHFLFWAGNFSNAKDDRSSGIYWGSLNGKQSRLVVPCHSSFGYDSDHLFYADEEQRIVSAAFDPSNGKISGTPVVVANTVGYQPATYWTALTVAGNGTLIYNPSVGAALSLLTWMDRSGKELGRIGEPAVMANPTLSPDGSRVAVDISDPKANNVDVWLESTTGAGNTRFTFNPEEEVAAVWSRDGSRVAYRANLPNGLGLFLKPASGLEREKPVTGAPGSEDMVPNSWSADDKTILVTHMTPAGSRLELVPAAGGTPARLLAGGGSQSNGMISPDGKWVAYASNESGNWEIYVTTFPDGAGKWQVSRGGGTEPRWRGDGNEIFYIGPTGILTSMPVNTQGTFSTGAPLALFQIQRRAPISSTDVFSYDVARDGKRFLVNRYVKPGHVAPLTILLHASEEPPK